MTQRMVNFIYSVYDLRWIMTMTVVTFTAVHFYKEHVREPESRRFFVIKDGRIIYDDLSVSEVLPPEELPEAIRPIRSDTDTESIE